MRPAEPWHRVGIMTDSSWVSIGPLDDIPEGEIIPVSPGGFAAIVVRRGYAVYAYEDRCTHVDYPLSTGYVDRDEIVCPWHGACFAVETGEIRCPPADGPLIAVPVRVQEGQVELCVRAGRQLADLDQ